MKQGVAGAPLFAGVVREVFLTEMTLTGREEGSGWGTHVHL